MRTFSKVVLTGFKSSGKTRIGKLLAGRLGFKFVDMDRIIEDKFENTGKPRAKVRTIYRKFGGEFFEGLESSGISHVAQLKDSVISLGGGAPLNPAFSKRDFRGSVFIYLKVSPGTLYRRIKAGGFPPFVDKRRPRKSLMELLARRKPYYENIADITVDNTSKKPVEVAGEIIKKLEELNGG